MRSAIKQWLREPLLHFLLIGMAIFGAFMVFSPPGGRQSSEIIVTRGMIDAQVEGFSRTWLRPPTREEIDDLIREYVREEVYYREALALGLDRDDTVVRRRLNQKLEFVAEAEGVATEPTEAELLAYLAEHRDAYRTDGEVSFVHVYLNAERRGETLAKDVEKLLADLRAGGTMTDATQLGDSTMLERVFEKVSLREVAAQFGEDFTTRIAMLPVGEWEGPVESPYGVHAVLVRERTEGRVPRLDEVRDAVRRDWLNAQRIAANEKYYQSLLQRYTVTIEPAS